VSGKSSLSRMSDPEPIQKASPEWVQDHFMKLDETGGDP
jgi:hypothetical protein